MELFIGGVLGVIPLLIIGTLWFKYIIPFLDKVAKKIELKTHKYVGFLFFMVVMIIILILMFGVPVYWAVNDIPGNGIYD